MDFKSGMKSRPKEVRSTGNVVFEKYDSNGVLVAFNPNQYECEAYGYEYNAQTGSCSAYRVNIALKSRIENLDNKFIGKNNTIRTGGANTLVVGETNTSNGLSRNNLLVGSGNTIYPVEATIPTAPFPAGETGVIDQGVNNSSAFGTKAELSADNTMVLGGNNGRDIYGKRQSVDLMYGVKTTNGNNNTSYLNNTPNSYFKLPRNSAFFFEAKVLAIRSGGTGAGVIGDYASWTEIGVAKSIFDVKSQTDILTIKRVRKNYASDGTTTGWLPTAILPTEGFSIRCRGAINTIIEWTSTINLTQIKLEDETPCPEQDCPEGSFWVEENCRCQDCQVLICPDGYEFSLEECRCVEIREIKK